MFNNIQLFNQRDKFNYYISTEKVSKNDVNILNTVELTNQIETKASFAPNINNEEILIWNDNKIISSDCKINKNIVDDFNSDNLIPSESNIKIFVNNTINDYLSNSVINFIPERSITYDKLNTNLL